jgi:hypothetical protein
MAASCQGTWDICSHITGAEPEQVRTKVLEMLRTNSGPGGVMTRPREVCGPRSHNTDSNNWPLSRKSHTSWSGQGDLNPSPKAVWEACLTNFQDLKEYIFPFNASCLLDHCQALKGSCPRSLPLWTPASKPLSYAMCRQHTGERGRKSCGSNPWTSSSCIAFRVTPWSSSL